MKSKTMRLVFLAGILGAPACNAAAFECGTLMTEMTKYISDPAISRNGGGINFTVVLSNGFADYRSTPASQTDYGRIRYAYGSAVLDVSLYNPLLLQGRYYANNANVGNLIDLSPNGDATPLGGHNYVAVDTPFLHVQGGENVAVYVYWGGLVAYQPLLNGTPAPGMPLLTAQATCNEQGQLIGAFNGGTAFIVTLTKRETTPAIH